MVTIRIPREGATYSETSGQQPTRATILWDNIVTYTMASCDDTNPIFPCSNYTNDDINITTRTNNDTGTKTWLIDLGSSNSEYYDTFAIAGHNFTSAGDFTIGRASIDTPSMASVDMTSTTFIHYWDYPSQDRYIKFTSSLDTTEDFHEIGVMYIGMRAELDYNPQIPIGIIEDNQVTELITGGGQRWTYNEYTTRGYSMNFIEDFTPEAYNDLKEMYDDRGKNKPFFFNLAPQDSNDKVLFVHTTEFDFDINHKDARPGRWAVEEEK